MKIISHLVWDESEQRMVEIYGTDKYKFKTAAIYYHPWQIPKEDKPPETERLFFENKNPCTCGVKFTGGKCSDWCDSLKPVEEYDLPF